MSDEHINYINAMRGLASIYVLAEQFHIFRGTVSNIWRGVPDAGKAIYNPLYLSPVS